MTTKGKLVFFDLDGTILDHDKRIPSSTAETVAALKRAGHTVAIATGRAPFKFREIRASLGIDSFVSLNGQYVEWEGRVLYENPIRPDLLESITAYAAAHDHPIVYLSNETMRSSMREHAHVTESISTLKVELPGYDPGYYRGRNIYQCLLFCTIGEEPAYRETFRELDFIRWHQFSMDVLPLGGSKANGIKRVLELLGTDPGDVYAFGDALNDIDMLRYVGHGVAMGNAVDSVKEAARYVTKAVDEDGIRHGARMVGLL